MVMETLKAADLCISLNTSCRSMPVTPRTMVIKTLLSCISLLTVVLNLLVIISIYHFRQLQTPTNLILLCLAVSDLLVGLVVMPPEIVMLQSCTFLDTNSCALFYLFSFILTSASFGSMVLISVDRYVAMCYPLRYPSMITPRRVQTCVSLCWFCSVTYNLMILKDHLSQMDLLNSCFQDCVLVINYNLVAVDLLVTFLSPVTVIIVLYMRVFMVAVSQARVMRSKISVLRSNTVTVKRSEMRAARTLGVILLVFVLCFLPYYSSSITGHNTTSVDSSVQLWLFGCNSTFNPLIYAFFYPWFRKSVKIIVSLQILQPGSCEAKIM